MCVSDVCVPGVSGMCVCACVCTHRYMAGDELLEVTPGGVRLRKVELSSDRRLKMARQAKGKE